MVLNAKKVLFPLPVWHCTFYGIIYCTGINALGAGFRGITMDLTPRRKINREKITPMTWLVLYGHGESLLSRVAVQQGQSIPHGRGVGMRSACAYQPQRSAFSVELFV